MKVAILMVPMLMLVLLSGCTEQTQLTGPVTTTSNVTTQGDNVPFSSAKFETMVEGPAGVVFFVSGSVDYTLSFNGAAYTLATMVNSDIKESGAAGAWTIASGKTFNSVLNDEGFDLVSGNHDFEFIAEKFPVYRLIIDYSVDLSGLKITDVRVGRASMAEGV